MLNTRHVKFIVEPCIRNQNCVLSTQKNFLQISFQMLTTPSKPIQFSSGPPNKKLPGLLYIQHPVQFLMNRFRILKLKLFWDRKFNEREFIYGAKQAATVITKIVHKNDPEQLHGLTTPSAQTRISKDMEESRHDPRIQLLKFRRQDFKRAIPAKIQLTTLNGKKFCVVDMLLVAMRNSEDMKPSEAKALQEDIRKYDFLHMIINDYENDVNSRVLFAEIFMRFIRDYNAGSINDWNVAFYKIIAFDVLKLK